MLEKESLLVEKKRIQIAAIPVMILIIIMSLLFLIENFLDCQLYTLGIYPLEKKGLLGILFSPLIHSSIKHLVSNITAIIILMWLLFYFYYQIAYWVFLFLWLLSGLLIWFIGREAWHIGASSIIYSLSFFLFFSGIFRRYTPLIAISLIVAFLYGSGTWNMFPWSTYLDKNVSWEGHLSGGISGFLVAIFSRKYGPQKPIKIWEEEEDENEDENGECSQEPTSHLESM